MENASKALIIAGAILLSILIIGLGMSVYNNASATLGSANMSAQEITSHNSQFEAYEGRVKGSQIRSLIGVVNQNNADYVDRQVLLSASDDVKASIDNAGDRVGGGANVDTTEAKDTYSATAQLKNNTTYIVKCYYDPNNLLNEVYIRGYSAPDPDAATTTTP